MCNRTLIGFHACKAEGDPIFPFLSNDHDKTWLTQGYYFWTDSDTWAQFWGQKSVKSRRFVILKCRIELAEDECLDKVLDEDFFNEAFARINAPAIAYPFLRAYIANLFVASGYDALMLPTVNFQALAEKINSNGKR